MTTLLTSCFTRWLLPTLYIAEPRAPSIIRRLLRPSFLCLAFCSMALYYGLLLSRPGAHSYYIGMIAWWASIPLALLLWGSSNFISRTPWKALVLSMAIPTFYLWGTDIFALRRGTWHISERTSLGIFPLPNLPVEEAVFFTVTNALLVVASYTFDRCLVISKLDAKLPYAPSYLPLNSASISSLWRTFIARDPVTASASERDGVMDDEDDTAAYLANLRTSLSILSKASRSFSMASLLLPWDLRSDLCILYAFCRAADDCVDEVREHAAPNATGGNSPALAQHQLHHRRRSSSLISTSRLRLLSDLVALIYRMDLPPHLVRKQIRDTLTTRNLELSTQSRENLRASASAVVHLRHLVPKSLWDELLRGYERDLDLDLGGSSARLRSMDDLVEYAQCVAGSVGEMCVRVVLGRCAPGEWEGLPSSGEWGLKRSIRYDAKRGFEGCAPDLAQRPGDAALLPRYLIYHARRMGVALQLVNVARDVIDDAVRLRRCYLPIDVIMGGGKGGEEEAELIQSALFAGKVSVARTATATGKTNGNSTPTLPSTPKSSRLPAISPAALRPTTLHLVHLATQLYSTSFPALTALGSVSPPTRSGLRAACSVYFGIAESIISQDAEQVERGERATMSSWERARRAGRAVWFGWG